MELASNNNRKNIIVGLLLELALFCCFLVCGFQFRGQQNGRIIYQLLFVFVLFRFFFCFIPRFSFHITIVALAASCLRETILGYSQILSLSSFHRNHILCGSFNNPGPYGGWLTICVCVLVAYLTICYRKNRNELLPKVLYYLIGLICLAAIMIIPSTQSRAALLALGCSMSFLFWGVLKQRKQLSAFIKRYGIIVCGLVLLMGVAAYFYKKPSADGRMLMNRINVLTILNNTQTVSEYKSFGGKYGDTQSKYFEKQIKEKGKRDLDWTVINKQERMVADCPEFAFNEYLQVGVDLGLFYLFLFLIIIIGVSVISFKNGSIWYYGIIAFAVFALFSYPLHLLKFQILFPVLLAAGLSSINNDLNKKLVFVEFLLIIPVIIFGIRPKMTVHRERKEYEKQWAQIYYYYQVEEYDEVVESCAPLFEKMRENQEFLFFYGQSLNKIGKYEESDSILKVGTLISSDPMFWNVMGNNSLALGRYREAEERYKHAFYMVPNRLYPLNLLAKLYHAEGDTIRFLEMSDMVESFIPKIESVNTERLRSEIRELKSNYISSFE